MRTKAILAGFESGIELILVLFIPLFIYLPGSILPEWGSANQILSDALIVAAILLASAGGWWAAKKQGSVTRLDGAANGALAGALAGLVVFWGLAAAAVGVQASSELLAYGLRQVPVESDFLRMLVDAVLQNIYWTFQVMWGLVVGGAFLGGIGGLLKKPDLVSRTDSNPFQTQLQILLSTASTLASVLAFSVTVAIFSQLPPAVEKTAQEIGYLPGLPTVGAQALPVLSSLLIYLLSLAWLTAAVVRGSNSKAREDQATASAAGYVGGLVSLFLVGFLMVIDPGLASTTVALAVGLLVSLLSILLLFFSVTLGKELRKDRRSQGDTRQPLARGFILHPDNNRAVYLPMVLGSTLAIFIPGFSGVIQVALNLVLLPVKLIPILLEGVPASETSVQMVRILYLNQGLSAAAGLVIVFLINLIYSMGVLALFRWIARRRQG